MSVLAVEVRRALRSGRTRVVMLATAAFIIASILIGASLREVHQEAGLRDVRASRGRIDRNKPAFDLSAWQDTLVARGVAPTSALIAQELAYLPDAAVIRIYEPPTMVPSVAERSPAATLLGTLDLVWVLVLLVPLAAIALGHDAISADRERGTLAMLLVPARWAPALLLSRTIALFFALTLAVLPGGAICMLVVGLPLTSVSYTLILMLVWCFFLSATVMSVSVVARQSSVALAVLLAGWLLLCVALPLASAGVARLAYPAPDPRQGLLGEHAAAELFAKPSEAVVRAEVERDPPLDPDLGADAQTSRARYYLLLSRERHRRAKGARYAADLARRRRAELSAITSWASPASILSRALSDLAGGPQEHVRFQQAAEDYRASLEAFVRTETLANNETLEGAWPELSRRPPRSMGLAAPLILLILALLALLGAGYYLSAGPLAPTKEDA